jgi:hypothetical protein
VRLIYCRLVDLIFWFDELSHLETPPAHAAPQMNYQPPSFPVRYQGIVSTPSSTVTDSSTRVSPFQPGSSAAHGSGSATDVKRERADFENQERSRTLRVSFLGSGDLSRNAQYSNSTRTNLDDRSHFDSEPPSYDDAPNELL